MEESHFRPASVHTGHLLFQTHRCEDLLAAAVGVHPDHFNPIEQRVEHLHQQATGRRGRQANWVRAVFDGGVPGGVLNIGFHLVNVAHLRVERHRPGPAGAETSVGGGGCRTPVDIVILRVGNVLHPLGFRSENRGPVGKGESSQSCAACGTGLSPLSEQFSTFRVVSEKFESDLLAGSAKGVGCRIVNGRPNIDGGESYGGAS